MLLINRKPLSISEALNDPKHPNHEYAKEYEEGVKELHKRFGRQMRFIRPDFPKYVEGSNERGDRIAQMPLPTTPMQVPLKCNANGRLGREIWMCCLDEPTVLPNGLWDMGRKRSFPIKENLTVDLDKDIELAYFLYFKSPFMNPKQGGRGSGQLKVYDETEDARKLGETEELITERKMAVWKLLKDDKLEMMARAYGVSVLNKQPQNIRQDLEKQLQTNDDLQRGNPAVKGTREFLEEMKVNDSVLLRNFAKRMIDEGRISFRADGRYKIGDKVVVQVPASEILKPFDYLCQYLSAGNNLEKLQEFLKDLLSPEYLDGIIEKKEWQWLYKVTGANPEFKKTGDIQNTVRTFFCPITS